MCLLDQDDNNVMNLHDYLLVTSLIYIYPCIEYVDNNYQSNLSQDYSVVRNADSSIDLVL